MSGKEPSTLQDSDPDDAPDLSGGDWPEKFARVAVRRGRPPSANPKVSTTIRLSPDVVDYFKADGRGWQTRIDNALREWIRERARGAVEGSMSRYLDQAPDIAPDPEDELPRR